MTVFEDRAAQLDHDHINAAAAWTAETLASTGHALVRLAPGDMTEYRIAITCPDIEWAYGEPRQGRYYWVTLCAGFGGGYEWRRQRLDGGYAAEKWANRSSGATTRRWTGEVMAVFLNAVRQAMLDLAVETEGP